MNNEKEYLEHVKESWKFAEKTAGDLTKMDSLDLTVKLALSIFDKTCSPHHYFLQNHPSEKPSEKQIAYASDLGITDPEKRTKQELSDLIDEAKKQFAATGRDKHNKL